MKIRVLTAFGLLLISGSLCGMNRVGSEPESPRPGEEQLTVGGGCFWCVEAVFMDLKGVRKVESGYSGGSVPNPSYQQVCSGNTGHAEVVQITYDPKTIGSKQLLEIFLTAHDPTTLNRQGADVGTQYRSVIFYRNPEQKAVADETIKKIQAAGIWDGKIVTELAPFKAFYKAEDYHQNYYNQNTNQQYCQVVIRPKVSKFRKNFSHLPK
jgi:peptide-methionine (S)-S-oxide reductase